MSHPNPDLLRDFVLGTLDDAGEREVREHLTAGCESCQATLHAEAALDHALWETRQAEHAAGGERDVPAVVVELPQRRPTPWWAMSGGLAVAASALVAVGLLWSSPDDDAPAPAPAATSVPAAEPPPPPAVTAPAVPAATSPEPAAAAPAAPAPAAAEPPPPAEKKPVKVASAAKPSTRRPRASAKPAPKPRAKPKARRDCDPLLDLDCAEKGGGGGAKKRALTPTEVLGVVRKNMPTINRCAVKHEVTGTVRMEWQIARDGKTRGVKVITPKYREHPVGACLVAAIKKWRFPTYTGSTPSPVKFPFKLKGRETP